jgi:THO complex subunit 4
MKVEIAFDMNQIQSLASRVAPAPAQARGGQQAGAGKKAGGARGGKAAGPRKEKVKPKSAEELDAEMSVSVIGSTYFCD